MNRADFRYLEPLRVRWAEVDMQKIVFNGHYLMYVDTAVAGYWRALAMPYHETMEHLGGDLFVRKATLEYEGSARYDERLEVGIACRHIGNSSMRFAAAVFRGEQRLVHGELVYVFADPVSMSSRPVPPALRELLLGYEAGEPVTELLVGDWASQQGDAMRLRHAVFAEEQGIPAELMSDDADAGALHALARNRFGLVLASGRLVPQDGGIGKIGRMAVHAATRGAGHGQAVLAALSTAGRERGLHTLVLNAQASAVGFYARLGYEAVGAPFEEAGIPHQAMRRRIA